MQYMRSLRAILAAIAIAAAWAPLALGQVTIPHDAPPMLRPGDQVKVTVWRNPELSGELLVADDGTLRHPLYQSVHVANVPLDSVTARIGAFLAQYTTNPQFAIEPEFRIVVRGEVRLPNLYTVPQEMTVGGAIATAGGPTESAQLKKVTLVRDGRAFRLDLTNPAAPWTAEPIRSGDQIVIGRKSNLFFGMVLPLLTASAAIASLISVLRR
jgi:protein involved in polysaccharide export with SLBB domain